MTLEEMMKEHATDSMCGKLWDAVPDTQLTDKPNDEIELIGRTGALGHTALYKWSNDTNTLYALHDESEEVTLTWMAPKYARRLKELLSEGLDDKDGDIDE